MTSRRVDRSDRDAAIAALSEQNMSIGEIARHLGIPASPVARSLARTAVARSGGSVDAYFADRRAVIVAAHTEGRSTADLSADWGVSTKTIREILRGATAEAEAMSRVARLQALRAGRSGCPHPAGRAEPVRFLHRRQAIPEEIRRHNLEVIASVADRFRLRTDPRRRSLEALYALWGAAETTFQAFDVEAADAVRAAAESSPLNGGDYPRGPRVVMSMIGSPAAICAALGSAVRSDETSSSPTPRSRLPAPERDTISRLAADGLSFTAIATAVGRSRDTVTRLLRATGERT